MNIDISLVEDRTEALRNKELIPNSLWERMVRRIVREYTLSRELSERIMDQTLGYLVITSHYLDSDMVVMPSPLVDIGWHTFLLYSRDYEEFCGKITQGNMIYHTPNDDPDSPIESQPMTVWELEQAADRYNIGFDRSLWYTADDQGNCKPCGGRSA